MRTLLALLISSLLAACSSSHHDVKVNEKYSVTLPVEMKPVATLHDNASLQQVDTVRPLYVVVIDESKEEMKKHELDYDLQLYYDNIVSRKFVESLPEVSITQPKKSNPNGSTALLTDITGKTAAEGVYYKVAVVETATDFYQVLVWTDAAKKNELEKEMEMIVGSFRELK